ncbi:MAG: hypothetical protein OXH01_03685 [Bacteroidetes bacterium]|nr:hypothetical protein [Bacteroidota bacterium]
MHGSHDADTLGSWFGIVVSRIVTSTELGLPAVNDDGRLLSATVNVSSSASVSSVVEIVPVPLVAPAPIVMEESEPKSPTSAVPAVCMSGIVTSLDSAADSIADTVTGSPSSTGFGETDSHTAGVVPPSPSRMVTSTALGLPAVTDDGRLLSATVNVSSSASASSVVEIVPVPLVEPALIVMEGSEPKSPASAVPAVCVSGIVTSLDSAADSVADTVTGSPSSTGFGETDSCTVGIALPSSSRIVTSTELGLPAVTDDGRLLSATVNVSSSASASSVVEIVPVSLVAPAPMVMELSVP